MSSVKLICVVVCLCVSTGAHIVRCDDSVGEKVTEGEWIETFAEIFGARKTEGYASGAQLAKSMELLHKGVEQLGDSLGDYERLLVNQWYNAMNDNNPEHCNSKYLKELTYNYNKIHMHANSNLEQVYFVAEKNLIAFCSEHHKDLAETVRHKIGNDSEASMRELMAKYKAWKNSDDSWKMRRELRYQVYAVAQVDKRLPKNTIINAWNNGPCGRVLTAVNSPELGPKADFIKFIMDLPLPLRSFVNVPVRRAIEVIEMCNDLGTKIPRFALYGNRGKDIVRNVEDLMSLGHTSD